MKSKKAQLGFTLVEILASLAIVAILTLVAVSTTSGIIDKQAKKTFSLAETSMIKAARYFTEGTMYSFPSTLGEQKDISYDDLVGGGYMTKIVDPKSDDECVESKIIIENIGVGEYEYIAALVCKNFSSVISD